MVKGLLAGPCEGVAGIIFGRPQIDLARASAVPDLTLDQIRKWAIEQQIQLARHGRLSEENSVALAAFGADGAQLVVGKLAGAAVNAEELRLALSELRQLVRVEGDVAYDEDDGVLEKDFRTNFEPDESLLEASKHSAPGWLKEVSGYEDIADSWSIKAVLNGALQSLGSDAEWRSEDRSVGSVNGVSITRDCRVAEVPGENTRGA